MISPQCTARALAAFVLLGLGSVSSCSWGGGDRPLQEDLSDGGVARPATGSASGDPAPACIVDASQHDQSCSADSDCVRVDFGNYCQWLCRCGDAAINRNSLRQFNADIAMTPLAQGLVPGVCSCGYIFGPCCRGGQCVTGPACGGS
jgi:hypothetical protein